MGNSIFVNEIFGIVQTLASQASGFPFFNVYHKTDISEPITILELAVAGYTQSELSVFTEKDNLVVQGTPGKEDETAMYQHRGISKRNFVKTFALKKGSKIIDVDLNGGILKITLKVQIPDEEARKDYKIRF